VRVEDIKAGSTHTCMLAEGGRVYTCGHKDYNGHGACAKEDLLTPRMLALDEPVTGVSVGPGGYHSLVVGRSGKVYSWGHNRVGQLGCEPKECEQRLNEGEVRLGGW
jgi:alpha-tubulin suppressor-like RCC1 family protein